MSAAVSAPLRAHPPSSPLGLSRLRPALLAMTFASLMVLAGCPPRSNVHPIFDGPPPPAAQVSMEDLAYTLGMTLDSSGQYVASMAGGGNSLIVSVQPATEAKLNGQKLDQPGEVKRIDGRLVVSRELALRLREHLRPSFYAPPPPNYPGSYGGRPQPSSPPPGGSAQWPQPPSASTGPQVIGTVVIDPGHGGKDRGTYCSTVGEEKQLALDVSLRIRSILAARGVKVIMTRSDDRFIELEERAAIANHAKADLFVAIHADNAPRNSQASGLTAYVAPDAGSGSEALAHRITAAMRPSGIESRGVNHNHNYRVLVDTKMPATLIELGFFSNRADAARLASSSYRQQLAEAIASGIIAALQHR